MIYHCNIYIYYIYIYANTHTHSHTLTHTPQTTIIIHHTIIGVTCDELDRIVHEATIARDAYPSPLNYYTFPKSVCTSVNEVICHGIPDMRPLEGKCSV